MVFVRPKDIEYPKEWHRFQRGTKVFKVVDLTADRYEEATAILLEHFVNDEPPSKHCDVRNKPATLKNLEHLWTTTLDHNLSLACVDDEVLDAKGKPKIVGLNVLTVLCQSDPEEPFQTEDPVWAKLFGAVELVSKGVDVYSAFHVDRYLTAYGLVVLPEYRGMGVGAEILRARVPLCRALGLRVTATVFTAVASQRAAAKAGFSTLYEISYEELATRGYRFPGVSASTKSSMLMALEIA